MKLEFLGAAHEVTGSCHYLEIGDKRLCVDIGMEQGRDLFENQEIPVNAAEIDYILGSLTLRLPLDFHNSLHHSPLRLIFLSNFKILLVIVCHCVV